MSIKTIRYFSAVIIAVATVLAGWWLWNYYMQSPWTCDGKVRAEQVFITPQVSGRIIELNIKDNQLVNAGDLLLTIDKTPFQIAELNARAQLAKTQSDLVKTNNEANRRHHLSRDFISAEELDTINPNVKAMQASVNAARTTLKQAQQQPARAEIRAPISGWIANLTTRIDDYTDTGEPPFALVDSRSFHVIDYLEETELRHIREGAPAQITLYSDNKMLQGRVSSTGRAVYDQSTESGSSLIPDVEPNIPWVRLAQRVPVRFMLDKIPGGAALVLDTTYSIAVGQ